MSDDTLPVNDEFRETFVIRGPQTGNVTISALSPTGTRLLCATDTSSLALTNTELGTTVAIADLGRSGLVTAMAWANSTHALVGCDDGYLFYVVDRSINWVRDLLVIAVQTVLIQSQ
jgi:hypothetical protein